MSHFYGTLQGSRGKATRCGTKKSGIETVAASWDGAIKVTLYRREDVQEDYAVVLLVPWNGKGITKCLYCGPVDGPKPPTNEDSAKKEAE